MNSYAFLLLLALIFDQAPNTCLSTEEERLLYAINDYRESRGLSPIPFSVRLTLVAKAHVRDLENNYNFSPDNPCNPHSWSENDIWTGCCYTNDHSEAACMWNKPMEIAEYDNPGFEIAYYASNGARADGALEGWISSPSHHPLLINSGQWSQVQWNAIGIGVYGKYAVVWFGQAEDPSDPVKCR